MLLAAVAAGALAGFSLGVAAMVARVPAASLRVTAVAVVTAVALDAAAVRHRAPRAPAVRTQVPVEWTTLLPLPTAAALYGGRLGVGPLTLATPWTWWIATALAASGGAGIAALVGGVFGATRITSILLASRIAERAMPVRMARLRRLESTASTILGTVVVGVAVASVVLMPA
jgi:hypothetical protein